MEFRSHCTPQAGPSTSTRPVRARSPSPELGSGATPFQFQAQAQHSLDTEDFRPQKRVKHEGAEVTDESLRPRGDNGTREKSPMNHPDEGQADVLEEDHVEEDMEDHSPCQPHEVDGPVWRDMPDWKGKEGVCPFFSLPPEVIDMILRSPILAAPDYISLADSCSIFRKCFSSTSHKIPLWEAITKFRPFIFEESLDPNFESEEERLVLARIFSGSQASLSLSTSSQEEEQEESESENEADEAIEDGLSRTGRLQWAKHAIMKRKINGIYAQEFYKLSEDELATLHHIIYSTEHSEITLYSEMAVQSLAYSLHGRQPSLASLEEDEFEQKLNYFHQDLEGTHYHAKNWIRAVDACFKEELEEDEDEVADEHFDNEVEQARSTCWQAEVDRGIAEDIDGVMDEVTAEYLDAEYEKAIEEHYGDEFDKATEKHLQDEIEKASEKHLIQKTEDAMFAIAREYTEEGKHRRISEEEFMDMAMDRAMEEIVDLAYEQVAEHASQEVFEFAYQNLIERSVDVIHERAFVQVDEEGWEKVEEMAWTEVRKMAYERTKDRTVGWW